MSTSHEPDSMIADLLLTGGEAGAILGSLNWREHVLGPMEHWPQSLRTSLSICLSSRYPICILWGPERIYFYNDAYAPIVGAKHPRALVAKYPEVWPEIWESDIRPILEAVEATGQASWSDNLLLVLERHGFPEECYFEFSFAPIRDETGNVGGVFTAITETTQQVVGERRLRTLRDIGARATEAKTVEDACLFAAGALAENRHDISYALLYLLEPGGGHARLVQSVGLEAGHACAPQRIALAGNNDKPELWPMSEVIRTHGPVAVPDAAERFGFLPGGPWPESSQRAVVLPLAKGGQDQPTGFLIAGTSPRRPFNDGYQGFLDIVAGSIASGIANAQAYEEARRRAEALAELDRAKTVFFSNVSHEFRTPLTLMLGPLDDILAKPGSELLQQNRELLTIVHRNGQRLLKLVNTLLDFSRIEAGRVQAVYEPVDLAAYTAELASVFHDAVERAGMRLTIDCPPLPEAAYIDIDMWEKIVLNLLSNAFKYTFEGEIEVVLRARDGMAMLSVRDTGTGIPESELPNLFNRFHRVEGARGRTQEGTGIGLALVLELAKLHGGTVGVESVVDGGSTFTVTLPLGSAHLPAEWIGGLRTLSSTALGANPFVEEALRWLPGNGAENTAALEISDAAPHAAHRPTADEGPKPTLVLADDNADMREYVRRLLAADYNVTAVADGLEALRAIAENRPDLVLTDVMMPNLDGFGLLNALRADSRTASIPVVMLSARAGEEAQLESRTAGADDYLIKPFSSRELLARVGGTLTLSRVRHEALRREEDLKAETANVLEMINEGFASFDEDFRFTYVNAETERIYGMAREKILGKIFWEVFPLMLGTVVESEYRRAMAERVPVRFEVMYAPWDRWLEVNLYPGKEGGLAMYFRDVTDRKLAMDALTQADRRKDEFLATLAHELRNPLAPLRSGLELMRLVGSDDPVIEETRAMMERQVGQMVRLIDDLLDVSRISRDRLELRRERIELGTALHNAVETSRPLIEAAGHKLTLSMPPEPIAVDGDMTRLAQVFSNLLNNSAKYSEPGGQITLTVERRGDTVAVTVRDTGVGIPKEMVTQIFEMFMQVDRSLETAHSGLGIGLTIVKRLVEMHGGTIEARSEGHGMGSEFVVVLPVAGPLVDSGIAGDTPVEIVAGHTRRRILVVDDNADSASSLARILELMGSEIVMAHDGYAALDVAARFRPDVMLLDIGMPKLSGYDVARRVRDEEWGKDIMLIALTGWGQEEDRRLSRAAGFDHHLLKPVEPAVLEKLLANMKVPNE